jgi:hypothetical protein
MSYFTLLAMVEQIDFRIFVSKITSDFWKPNFSIMTFYFIGYCLCKNDKIGFCKIVSQFYYLGVMDGIGFVIFWNSVKLKLTF